LLINNVGRVSRRVMAVDRGMMAVGQGFIHSD
jgi:hypothetical protein